MRKARKADLVRRQRLGQFFTPRPVADFVWRMLRIWHRGPLGPPCRVIDPACGDAVFILSGLAEAQLSAGQFTGVDIDPYLRPDWAVRPELAEATLLIANGLVDYAGCGVEADQFDIAVGNPPYGGEGLRDLRSLLSEDGEPQERKRWAELALFLTERYESWQGNGRRAARPGPKLSVGNLIEARRGTRTAKLIRRLSGSRIELLFVERFLQLVKPGGLAAIVLPEGVFANSSMRPFRQWLLGRAQILAIVTLPKHTFGGERTSAKTAVLFMQKAAAQAQPGTLVASAASAERDPAALEEQLARVVEGADALCEGAVPTREEAPFINVVPREQLVARMDPEFHHPRYDRSLNELETLGWPVRTLADYEEHFAQGVNGDYSIRGDDLFFIGQSQILRGGLSLRNAFRIPEGCELDRAKSRVRPGDLLLARSGEGGIARRRWCVVLDPVEANIASFVDLLRFKGVRPEYVAVYLWTRYGWSQIERLINGVSLPNISLRELRQLRVPEIPDEVQAVVAARYVAASRRISEADEGASKDNVRDAQQQLDVIAGDLEQYLRSRDLHQLSSR